ncbi:E motif [Dillenia turbinata]|uniref:E motif n=1 Tax=Dillenia turbinata TaxID=194707 RepID=A0AAN8ULA1_9MAGN
MEIGEWAAEKLLEMKPANAGYYALIGIMYAASKYWSKLAEVRTFMKDSGVRKAPGYAWVDLGTGFSPFLVEDTSNPEVLGVYPLMNGLTKIMKEAGYVPTEDFFPASHASDECSEAWSLNCAVNH